MVKAKEFLRELKRELAKVPVPAEQIRKRLLFATVLGIVVWGGFAFAAAAMVVSLGGWAWVAYPFAIYFWSGHAAKAVKIYTDYNKPKPKWEQNVTVNVTSELTEEQIADAAARAMANETYFKLQTKA